MELIPLPELPKIDMFIVNLGGTSSRVNMVESEAVPDSGSGGYIKRGGHNLFQKNPQRHDKKKVWIAYDTSPEELALIATA